MIDRVSLDGMGAQNNGGSARGLVGQGAGPSRRGDSPLLLPGLRSTGA
jgi:hypothetical protein